MQSANIPTLLFRCVALFFVLLWIQASPALAISSTNIPLDSTIYLYLEKLAGLGLITSDIKGVKPYSKAEAARLLTEAEQYLSSNPSEMSPFVSQLLQRLHEFLPREIQFREFELKPPLFDINPIASAKMRYVYLNGVARNYNRDSWDPAHQSAFGFIGGDLRPLGNGGLVHTSGTEGTPLLENNEGVIYHQGSTGDLRWSMEGFASDKAALLIEPELLLEAQGCRLGLRKAYFSVGSGGVALEIGRDANWFGPGYRGSTVFTNNARNFDQVKIWSPEPVDVDWVKRWVGDFKYSLIVSRFDETGSGSTLRQPWLIGLKLAAKPRQWFEWGINFVRQQGGPGFTSEAKLSDEIFGGGDTNHNNTIAGADLRFRIPWLCNTELYGEYSGEDNAGGVWPIVESYVAGVFVPNLTSSGKDDLRFEYFLGSTMLYGDWKFPAGYVYHGMTPGHSQGTNAQEFFVRYSHWFNSRNLLALEYFHTERGRVGRVLVNSLGQYDPAHGVMQATEYKNAGRISWNLPLYGDWDLALMYGAEHINNFNLVAGVGRTNQLFRVDFSYRY